MAIAITFLAGLSKPGMPDQGVDHLPLTER